jgi:hypothetical protein
MDEFNVAYSMDEWFNAPNNMHEWMVWHITVATMSWREIQNLNYNWKLFETMSICIVEISWHPNYNHIFHPSMDEGTAFI